MSHPYRYTIEINFDRTYPLGDFDLQQDKDYIRDALQEVIKLKLGELYSRGQITRPEQVYIGREILSEVNYDRELNREYQPI